MAYEVGITATLKNGSITILFVLFMMKSQTWINELKQINILFITEVSVHL